MITFPSIFDHSAFLALTTQSPLNPNPLPPTMIQWLFPKIIGGKNEREVNRIRPTVARINEIEGALQREPVEKLLHLTASWRDHLARYHALDAPPKSLIEHMDEAALRATAAAIEARLTVLRKNSRHFRGMSQPQPRRSNPRKPHSIRSRAASPNPAPGIWRRSFPRPTPW
jgi:hypothetical protein